SATQDMAIDAYRTDLLPAEERGLGAAYYVTGYRVAMLVSGGLALILAGEFLGWKGTYLLMAAIVACGAGVTALSPALHRDESEHAKAARSSIVVIVKESFKDFMTRENALWLLGLILLYKVGDAFAGSLTTTFLLRGLGFTLTEVGAVNKTVSLVATLLGTFVGGWAMVRMGLYASLMVFGVAQGVSNLSFWALSLYEPDIVGMGAAVFYRKPVWRHGYRCFCGTYYLYVLTAVFGHTVRLVFLVGLGGARVPGSTRWVCGGKRGLGPLFYLLHPCCPARFACFVVS
ncbi:MAG: MFS transporter, partial [Limnobacter sp.]|nr:MFS transporter [Limnobacter sp.]